MNTEDQNKKYATTEISEDEAVNLLTGDDYILFYDMKGSIVIWINCDQEMEVRLSSKDFRKTVYKLFPNIQIPILIKYLNQGQYVYTDKLQLKLVRPQNFEFVNLVPTLADINRALSANRQYV